MQRFINVVYTGTGKLLEYACLGLTLCLAMLQSRDKDDSLIAGTYSVPPCGRLKQYR